jgi:hypothetical protein
MPEIQFKGKEFVYNHHLTVPYRPLIAVPEKSIPSSMDEKAGGESSENLIIQGDNLHALKALLPLYAGNRKRSRPASRRWTPAMSIVTTHQPRRSSITSKPD